MKDKNIIQEKSFKFALRAVNVYKVLINERKEFVLSKQFLRSATSIGANVEEILKIIGSIQKTLKKFVILKPDKPEKYKYFNCHGFQPVDLCTSMHPVPELKRLCEKSFCEKFFFNKSLILTFSY